MGLQSLILKDDLERAIAAEDLHGLLRTIDDAEHSQAKRDKDLQQLLQKAKEEAKVRSDAISCLEQVIGATDLDALEKEIQKTKCNVPSMLEKARSELNRRQKALTEISKAIESEKVRKELAQRKQRATAPVESCGTR